MDIGLTALFHKTLMLQKQQPKKSKPLGVMGFHSHHKILAQTTVVKAERKPGRRMAGRWQS